MTVTEMIEVLEKKIIELTEEWNTAMLNRDPIKANDAETRLIAAQTELNTLKMRRPV